MKLTSLKYFGAKSNESGGIGFSIGGELHIKGCFCVCMLDLLKKPSDNHEAMVRVYNEKVEQ